MTLRLLIVRHGLTDWNMEERMQGRSDVTLNKEGIAQCKKLARHLSKEKIDLIFTSEMSRARDTAELIARKKIKVIVDPNFNEIDYGIFDGKSLKEIESHPLLSKLWRQRKKDRYKFRIPLGESYADVQTRIMSSLRRIIELYDDHTILIVTHGIVKRLIVMTLLGLDLEEMMKKHSFTNASVTELQIKDGKVKAKKIASVTHLK